MGKYPLNLCNAPFAFYGMRYSDYCRLRISILLPRREET
nr:MAG TPA: hypothetical protein [Caudoviricetes sp.]